MPTKTKHRKRWKIFAGIVLILVAGRLILPTIILHYANKTLAHMEGYYGHINDIDLALYRGAYQVDDFYLNKVDSATHEETEFMAVKRIDLSIEWRALFRGKLVGELEFNTGKLIFTRNKTELGQVARDTNDFRKLLKDFMPLKVNKFEIHNSSIHYIDETSSPVVDVALSNTHILATNLTNAEKKENVLPSDIKAEAMAYGGTLDFNMRLDPLSKKALFDMDARLQNTDLRQLNDFFKAYGNFDVNRGTLGLYTEFAAKDGNFKGYVKPLVKELDVLGPEDREDTYLQKLWEGIVGTAGVIFKNPKKEQVGTKVPIEGSFQNPDIANLEAVWELIRNAFIQALVPAIDQQIDISSVGVDKNADNRTIFQRVLGVSDSDKDGISDRKERRQERREERKNK